MAKRERNEEAGQERGRAPRHLWVVGIATLVWNGFGALDHYMSQTFNVAYLQSAGITQEQLEWLASFPWWANAAWALGAWGALLGSVLLLARSRWALTAYIASLVGIVPMTAFQFASDHPGSLDGTVPTIFAIVLILVTGAQAYYALRMRQAGILR